MQRLMRYLISTIRVVKTKAKVHPLPFILLVVFMLFTLFGISGSSMSAFDKIVSGDTPGIAAGQARLIRSDEWNWQTQQTIAQQMAGYPEFNKNIGLGENTSIILDVPFKGFFGLFKPQNLFFFVLPFDNAFAAKWWFMSLVVVLGFYFLFNKLFPGHRLIVSLGALLLLFNPFVQWWYQSITLLAVGYALWAGFFAVSIFTGEERKKWLVLYGAGLAYSSLCFLFLLYPPFQLSIIYGLAALLAGFFWYRYRKQRLPLREDRRRWLAVVLAMVAVAVVSLSFFVTHKQIIHDVRNTVYPGVRNITSGDSGHESGAGFNILQTFSAPTLFKLQDDEAPFYSVQSEAGRIAAINLVMLPLLVWLIFKKPKKDRGLADYLLLSTTILAGIILVRLFTPLFNLPFKLLLFHQVQNQRLAFALVLLCVMQLVLLGVFLSKAGKKISFKQAGAVTLAAFLIFFDASIVMSHLYPEFISGFSVLLVCLLVSLCVFLMLRKKTFAIGLAIFLIFNMGSSIFINPLYTRAKPLALEQIANHIAVRYPDDKGWLSLGSVFFENVPLVAGKQSFSGIQYYPQFELWQRLDPQKKEIDTYNRFAHVIFVTDLPTDQNKLFHSPHPDVLQVRFTCDVASKLPNLGYVLSSEEVDTTKFPCLKLVDVITYPAAVLRIYAHNAQSS